MAQIQTAVKTDTEIREGGDMLPATLDSLRQSDWAEALEIPVKVIEEVKQFSALGWALDSNNKPRALTQAEMKMCALACHRTGLSMMGKQIIFLGNGLYVTVGGKRSKARRDSDMPFIRMDVRPATPDERKAYGVVNDDPKLPNLFEHVWVADVYAKVEGEIMKVASAYGHACLSNIHLKYKENDPRRLCADMASTRAQSRALSQVYDFFGMDSYEEVGLTQIAPNFEVIPEKPKSLHQQLKDKAEMISAGTPDPVAVSPSPPAAEPEIDSEPSRSADVPQVTPSAGQAPVNLESGPVDPQPTGVDTPSPAPVKLEEVTVQDVLKFIDEHRGCLPPADINRYTPAKLKRYLPEVLAVTLGTLRGTVARYTKAAVSETAEG